jgi:uncharacterized protein YcnI
MSRVLGRLGTVLSVMLMLVVGGGAAAVAHVSVHADEAVQGGTAEIAFRVPTESDTASTVSLAVAFPSDAPIAHVAVLPLEGWTYEITKTATSAPVAAGHGEEVSEVVSQIEWRASPDAGIKPGEYQVFRISAGPLPRTDRLIFKVVQTYTDGQVARWIDEPAADGSEPENPAPVLALDAADSATHTHGDVEPVAASAPATTPTPAWWAAVTIAMVALVAALASVVVAIRTSRRGGGDTPPV